VKLILLIKKAGKSLKQGKQEKEGKYKNKILSLKLKKKSGKGKQENVETKVSTPFPQLSTRIKPKNL
jgi:hypothetical protein